MSSNTISPNYLPGNSAGSSMFVSTNAENEYTFVATPSNDLTVSDGFVDLLYHCDWRSVHGITMSNLAISKELTMDGFTGELSMNSVAGHNTVRVKNMTPEKNADFVFTLFNTLFISDGDNVTVNMHSGFTRNLVLDNLTKFMLTATHMQFGSIEGRCPINLDLDSTTVKNIAIVVDHSLKFNRVMLSLGSTIDVSNECERIVISDCTELGSAHIASYNNTPMSTRFEIENSNLSMVRFENVCPNKYSTFYRTIGDGRYIKHLSHDKIFLNWTSDTLFVSIDVGLIWNIEISLSAINLWNFQESQEDAFNQIPTWMIECVMDNPAEPFPEIS